MASSWAQGCGPSNFFSLSSESKDDCLWASGKIVGRCSVNVRSCFSFIREHCNFPTCLLSMKILFLKTKTVMSYVAK